MPSSFIQQSQNKIYSEGHDTGPTELSNLSNCLTKLKLSNLHYKKILQLFEL